MLSREEVEKSVLEGRKGGSVWVGWEGEFGGGSVLRMKINMS